MNHIITKLPMDYVRAVDMGLQGSITEVSYGVKNYINSSRKLVTNQKIDSKEVGRETVEGEEIFKKCNVYLPSGYDKEDINTRYNVLYLLHGVGGDRNEWLSGNGMTDNNYIICNIVDNLIASGEIEPLIIVFPEGRSAYHWTDRSFNTQGTNILGFYYFDYELRYDLIPFVESKYKTYANSNVKTPEAIDYNRKHRAIAGLSMGGMQSLNLTLGGYRCDSTTVTETVSPWDNGLDTTVSTPGMLDLFAYVAAFSNAPTTSDGQKLGAGILSSDYKLSLLYLTCGDADEIAYQVGYEKAIDQLSETAGDKLIQYNTEIIEGGIHDFDVWNKGAYQFVRLAFENEKYRRK